MLSQDAAFDRIGTTLLQLGYKARERDAEGRLRNQSPNSRPPTWRARLLLRPARLLTIQVTHDGEWSISPSADVGPKGMQEDAVEALVHALRNEVDETSTDGG